MKVAVLHDGAAGSANARPDVAGVLAAVRAVVRSLAERGHSVTTVAVNPPLALLRSRLTGVDLAFNLVEGLGGRAEGEAMVAALLELAGVPRTGASSETLSLCRRKDRVNAILAAAGLPVPAWALAGTGSDGQWTRFPAIVKPVDEDGSVGIWESSVVENTLELRLAVGRVGVAAMVQDFIGGRELNVAIVGDTVLPVSEIRFSDRNGS
jgi:D-alanine-D-alanine ligase